MLDINLIRDNPDLIKKGLQKRGYELDFEKFLALDSKRRNIIMEVEQMKAERNKNSSLVPQLKKEGKSVDKLIATTKELGEAIKQKDEELAKVTQEFNEIYFAIPNLPDEDLLAGGKENNKPIYTFGKKPEFNFEPKNHVDLCTSLGLIDYETARNLSGSGFWMYRGEGARLEWALLNFFIEEHLKDGFEFILPPVILNTQCGFGSGQFPKFSDDVYILQAEDSWDKAKGEKMEPREQFLLPTAETALVNLYAGKIIPEADLPKKFFAYTPCFRREAGSYRAEERGMIRGHQFNKVEMVAYTRPEDSDKMFELLVKKAQTLVEKLGLHFQISKLASGDVSATMCRTYDIEVWLPSMGIYKEVSSVSNGREYQARRSNTRYKTTDGKNEFVSLLNGSGLATARILPAIVEQFQNKDGSITIPEVLRKFMGGQERIELKK